MPVRVLWEQWDVMPRKTASCNYDSPGVLFAGLPVYDGNI
jgi:hypothetical protein